MRLGILIFAANEKLVEQQVAEEIIRKIYLKLAVDLTIIPLPPLRGREKNLRGKIDGEIARIYMYGVNNPSLIRVEPSYFYLKSSAFCKDPKKIHIEKKEDLKGYTVAVIRGVAHSEEAVKGNSKTIVINDGLQMYDMLLAGRADIAIDTSINGRKIIKKKRYMGIKECGTFAKHDLYIYLNSQSKKHKKIISLMIKKLKESGELDLMIKRAEEEYLSRP